MFRSFSLIFSPFVLPPPAEAPKYRNIEALISMSFLSGLLVTLAMVFAVIFGGQTRDLTWGPGMLALGASLLAALAGGAGSLRGRGVWVPLGFVVLACAWIWWRCWHSPVAEFARADALLAAAMLSGLLWVLLQRSGGGVRVLMAGLSLLTITNLAICLIQLRDPAFSVLFASRPAVFPSGWFGHYNHLADFSAAAAGLLAARSFMAGDRLAERLLQGLGALAGVVCVLLSNSRGGLLATAAMLAVLVVCAFLVAWRDKSPRKVPLGLAALAMPVLLGAAILFFLQQFQEKRGAGVELQTVADNSGRLTFLEVAWDAVRSEPLTGGGSRSFGWRKYEFWNPSNATGGKRDDDFVHNELMQVAVDYGWIGAGLVAAAVFLVIVYGLAGLLLRDEKARNVDAMACGGLAALAGTLLHSNLSFVTHTLPGALYLGVAMGFVLPRAEDRNGEGRAAGFPAGRIAAGTAALLLGIGLCWQGLQASRAFRTMWPAVYGKGSYAASVPEAALDRIGTAMELWPGGDLAGYGGHLARRVAESGSIPEEENTILRERAQDLYREASRLHPLDPEWAVNRANVLSILGRGDEAEEEFARALRLQGEMETTFRVRYYYARHLYARWHRLWIEERRAEEALGQFLAARTLLEESAAYPHWRGPREQAEQLLEGIGKSIRFLEEAGVKPKAPAD